MHDSSLGADAVDAPTPAVQPQTASAGAIRRVALGVSYLGCAYKGWQSQPGGGTVQDVLESALSTFAVKPIKVVCAGRTDAGVHGINQVVHLDTDIARASFSWVRGTNTFLPPDIAVQWAMEVPRDFHARNSAMGRRYTYVLLQAPVRPSLEAGRVGWVFRPLDVDAMREAASHLIGEHDFSSFRSSMCQSPTPVKWLREIRISCSPAPRRPISAHSHDAVLSDRYPPAGQGPMSALDGRGLYWRFDFEGQAFLHHMIRNIMGCLVAVGSGTRRPGWMLEVLAARRREVAAPTFSPDGLYFLGPTYDPCYGIPNVTPALAWLPEAGKDVAQG